MPIDLLGAKSDSKTKAEYSYPLINVITPTRTTTSPIEYRFFLQNTSNQLSFSYSDGKNKYISGVGSNARIIGTSHTTSKTHTAELVIEHNTSSGTTFYVVIPLNQNSGISASSQIDKLLSAETTSTSIPFILNQDLGTFNIIYYQTAQSKDVFVFDTVIQIKTPDIKNLTPDNTIFSSIKTSVSPVKTSGALQVSDEIVCEYEGNVSTKTPKADVNDVNNIYVWATFLILLLIVLLFGFTLFSNSNGIDDKTKNRLFLIFGVVGFILVIVFLSLWSKNTNKTGARITYGSLTMMSLMFMGLSYVAFTGYFVNEQRTGPEMFDKLKDALRRNERVGIAP